MGRFYEPLGQALFGALPGALSLAAALMVALLRHPVLRLMEPHK